MSSQTLAGRSAVFHDLVVISQGHARLWDHRLAQRSCWRYQRTLRCAAECTAAQFRAGALKGLQTRCLRAQEHGASDKSAHEIMPFPKPCALHTLIIRFCAAAAARHF